MASTLTLPNFLQVDSRLLAGSSKQLEVRKGATSAVVQRTLYSNISNSGVTWTTQLPNASTTILDSYMYGEYGFTFTITAAGLPVGQTVKNYLTNNCALRQYPIASITNTLRVDINEVSPSCQPYQWIHQLGWFQNFINGEDQQVSQGVPVMPDMCQSYDQAVGSSKSPLNSYFVGSGIYDEPRGSYNTQFVDVVNNINTWQFNVTIREPFFHPCLEFNPMKQREGLPYITRFSITATFLSNLSRMLSIDTVTCPAITGVTVNLNTATLVQSMLTSPLTQIRAPVVVRGYNNIVSQPTQLQQTFNPGVPTQISSQVIQLGMLPDKLFLYVSGLSNFDTPTGFGLTDTNFSIQEVVILFNNVSGILSDMYPYDLWQQLCASENSKVTWPQNTNFVGSILCIDPAKFFRLQNEAPGMLGNFQLQVTLTCTNISNAPIVNPSLWITSTLPTLMVTTDKFHSSLSNGYLTAQDVAQANSLPAHPITTFHSEIYGSGGPFSDLLKRALGYVRENKLISKVALPALAQVFPAAAPYLPAAQSIASSLGVGNGGRRTSRREMMESALRY